MLTLEGISKEYNLRPVLEDIHLTLKTGTVYTLTAPNGSGKTTLLQVMAGLVRPTKGRVLYGGQPIRPKDRQRIGVLLQQPILYADLTGMENLRFFSRLYSGKRTRQELLGWLERVGLGEAADERVRAFSKGMKQRLAIARCFVHQPEVLLLDEPFDGLDEGGRRVLTELLQEARDAGTSAFLITHRSDEVNVPVERLTMRYGRVLPC